MIIKVADLVGNKFVTIDVDEEARLEEIVNLIIEKLGLPENYSYSVVHRGKELGPDKFQMTIKELGIAEGDEIQLIGRPEGG